ncbi:MAG: 16S rRNA (cytosine(1402)-N(4))-methyltransferase RsmH [Alphaproteobacteria bacterium]|nr:16S rRNA (cytosine(1402)-N(4))-methyltransferase RsmH [Alphaproteobacteria bacterium]
MEQQSVKHIPVMLDEVLQYLQPHDGGLYVDSTFGNGGYSEAILKSADCKVIAIDRDPTVRQRAEELAAKYPWRFEFRAGCFGNFADIISEEIDGAVFDIGVSSMQIDNAERGFSFSKEAKLDMRMSCDGISAKDIVNTYSENDLADLIYNYGEERKSRVIARKIVEYRQQKEIETTTELADIIYDICSPKFGELNPATRTFQALRIAVNDELGELEKGLKAASLRLKSGGRLVVVDFHSLEDRIVKLFFKENSNKRERVSKYAEISAETKPQAEKKLFCEISKVIIPTKEECNKNFRAHSAKLRYAVKG